MEKQRSAKGNRTRIRLINGLKLFLWSSKPNTQSYRVSNRWELVSQPHKRSETRTFLAHLSQHFRSLFGKRRKAQRRSTFRIQLRTELLESRQLLATFSNTSPITITDNSAANPYPSQIAVAGLTGVVSDVNVTLNGFSHDYASDVDILLVGPQGQAVVLMSDTFGSTSVSNRTYTFDDSAFLNPSAGANSGTYKPFNDVGSTPDVFPVPAPSGPYDSDLNTFNLTQANGTWSLYVVDDAAGQAGLIANGWSLDIVTSVTPTVAGDANDNALLVRNNAGNISLVDVVADGRTRTFPKNAVASLSFSGNSGNDTLTVDYSNGNPIPIGGLSYDGGIGGVDDLVVQGGPGFSSVFYNATAVGGGTLSLSGSQINFSGLEPVTVTSAVGAVTINIDPLDAIAGPITTTVSDDSGATMTVATDVGLESITFATPTVSLTVNGDATDGDTINVASVDANAPFRAALTINGNGGGSDVINVNAALLLGSATSTGNLSLSATTINLNATTINTDAGANSGSVSFTGDVVLGTSVSIDTNGAGIDGGVFFSSALRADATANNRDLSVSSGGANLSFSGAIGINAANQPRDLMIVDAAGVNFANAVNLSRDLTQSSGTGSTTFRGGLIGRNLSVTTNAITFLNANLTTNATASGSFNLNAQNAVTINNVSVDSNSSPIDVRANQDGVGGEDFVQVGNGSLQTSNNTISAVNVSVGGTPGSGADARLNVLRSGSGGRVTVTTSGGSILDEANDILPEIQAGGNLAIQSVVLIAADGIGTALNPLEVNVEQADIANSTSGGVFLVDTSGGLVLTNLVGANAVDNGAGGPAFTSGNSLIQAGNALSLAGALTISGNALTNSGAGNRMTYTSQDSASSNEDLTVNPAVMVQESSGSMVLNVGDNLLINSTAIVRAAESLTINLDTNTPSGDTLGSNARIFGTIRSDGVLPAGLKINGGTNNDVIQIDSNGGALGDGGSLSNVVTAAAAPFTFDGNGGTDELQLDDSGTAGSANYGISSSKVTRSSPAGFGGMNYSGLSKLNLATGSGSNNVTLDGTTASLSALEIDTGDSNDNLTIDYSLGNPVPSGGLKFNGGAGTNDSMTLAGGSTSKIEHVFTNENDGSVVLTGTLAGKITYLGLNPIIDNLSAIDRVFTFNFGTETIDLSDNVAADGKMKIDSNIGGESVEFSNPSNSLTIHAGSGNDTVNINSVDSGYNAAFTINGDAGNDTINLNGDISFASGKNLDVDLQDDASSGDEDRILIGTNTNLITSGVGSITLKSSRDIFADLGSSLETSDGNLIIEANLQTTTTTGEFNGIFLSTASVKSSGMGAILLNGKGGIGTVASNVGLRLNTSSIESTGSGAVTLQGTGGSGFAGNAGIRLGLFSRVTSTSGDISLTGKGGSGTTASSGVIIENSKITATGTTKLSIDGKGGSGTSINNGVEINFSSVVSAEDGSLTIEGVGGPGTGDGNRGIGIFGTGTKVLVSGTGLLSMTGTGGGASGTNSNAGIRIGITGSAFAGGNVISTSDSLSSTGNIVLTATPGIGSSFGVEMSNTATISTVNTSSIGTANVTIFADSVSIDGSSLIDVGNKTATFIQKTNGTMIDIGGADTAGKLGLLDAELDRVTADNLSIGNSNSGAVTISSAISRTAATNVQVEAGSGNNIVFDTAGSIDSSNGNIHLKTAGSGSILSGTAANDLISGTGTIRFDADTGAIGSAGSPISMSGSSLSATSNGNMFFSATGSIAIDAAGISAGSNSIQLEGGTFTLPAGNRINDATKLNIAGATFSLGANNETLDTVTLISGTIAGTTGVLTSTNTIQTRSGNANAILAGTNGLTQSTSGTTNLAAVNIYTGVTTIDGGRLNVNGSIVDGTSTPDVIVNNTGTLGGTGSVLGTVQANAGGKVSPGLSPGILSTGSISYASGAELTIEVNGQVAGTTHDQLNVTGSVTLNNATLNASGTVVSATSWVAVIINNDGSDAVSGTFNGLPEGATVVIDGVNFTISYVGGSNNNDVVLKAPPQQPPNLINPGSQTIPHGGVNGIVNLIATDPNNDPLTFNAVAQSAEYLLDQQLGLSPAPLTMYLNWGGLKEKWFTGSSYPFYYMTPDGNLYLWRGGALSNDPLIATLSPAIYDNPALLYNATLSSAPVSLSLVGNVLTINPNDDFIGSFLIVATVSDGFGGSDSETFSVTVSGPAPDTSAPTITNRTPVPSSTITSSIVNIDVTFSETVTGVDATDLVLTGTGAASAVKGAPTNIGANTWRFPVSNLVNGVVNVSLAPDANDIEDSAGNDLAGLTWSYNVSLSVAQQPPVLNPIPDQSVANGSVNAVVNLIAIDPNNDPLIFSGTAQTIERYIDQKLNLSFSGSYYYNFGGLLEKWLNGSGGWYYIQPNGKLYQWLGGDPENAVFVEQLSTAAYQDPSLLFNAPVNAGQATVQVVGNTMTVNPSDNFSGRLAVIATVNDPLGGTDSEVFFVDVGPTFFKLGPPEIVSITPNANTLINQSELFIDVVFTEPVFRIEPPDLILTGPAAGKATNGPAIPVGDMTWRFLVSNLSNGHLSITLGSDQHDVQDLNMVDFESVSWSYEVEISSPTQSPTLDPIGNQNIAIGPATTSIPVSATDPNGDPLTFSAVVQSQAFYWDQSLGLMLTGNLFTNFGGKNEKWLLGAGHQWYYITPAGELYRWSGQANLVGDELITQLSTLNYTNIDQLANATNTSPASVSVAGNLLQITPNVGFTGVFYVIVTVSDSTGKTDSEAVKISVGI